VLVPKRTLMIGGGLVLVVGMYSMGSDQNAAEPTSGQAQCKVSVTADVLNVRAAPDAKAEVVGKFKQGVETAADPQVQNGFRKIGENRWAANDFLKPLDGHNCG